MGSEIKGLGVIGKMAKKKPKKTSVLKLHKPQKNVTYIKAPTSWNSGEFKFE